MKNLVPIIFSLLLFMINTAAIAQNRVVVIPMGGDKGTVAKTGQTVCYDPECIDVTDAPCDVVLCTGTGQDGEFQMGKGKEPRLADNGNGTVTDRLTGLTWLKNGGCTDFFAGDPALQNARPWPAALEAVKKLSSGYCGLDDGSEEGDWRLPNIRELLSLVDYSQINPALPSGHPFTQIVSGLYLYYWTSTSHTDGPYAAWGMSFLYGGDTWQYKSEDHYVLAVRGGR